MTQSGQFWNSVYDDAVAPWVIGEPQPAIVDLIDRGWVRGRVLDVGCGAGEHTIELATRGCDVLGIDFATSAIAQAEANAAARGVPARFAVADARDLGEARFDTIIDSALFHVFAVDGGDTGDYVRSLHRACVPGGMVHILALSDTEPGFGPRIGASAVRDAFTDGWVLEELAPARFRGRVTRVVGNAAELGFAPDSIVDTAAWLARVRRD
jgi:cyclopropane fatty-acyl-phospholipid synthase-like methyltransferase